MPLRLAHVAELFPFIYKSNTGKRGYTVEPDTGQFSGVLGMLQNATVDGIVEDFTYRSSRMDYFYVTVPIDWTVENFYERADPTTIGFIESFVVFPPLLLYLFLTSAMLVIVTERVIFVLRLNIRTEYLMQTSSSLILVNSLLGQPVYERQGFLSNSGRRLVSFVHAFFFLSPTFSINVFDVKRRTLSLFIYLIAILSIVIIYSATFAGFASVSSSAPPTTIKQLISELRTGSRTLLVQNEALIKHATALEMFGEDVTDDFRRFRVIPEIQNQIDLICSSDQFVSFETAFQTFSYPPGAPLRFPCALQIMAGKHLGRKFKRWFNQVILRMFNERMMVDIWWRRYTNRPRRDTTVTPKHTFNPVPLRAFHIPNTVCGSLLVIAFLILCLEWIHDRFTFHRRVIRKLTRILPESARYLTR